MLASTERARDDLSERERALVAQVQELVAQIRHYEAAAAVVGKFVGVDRESLETLFVGGDSPAESFQRLERLRLLLEHFRDDVAASATSAPLDRVGANGASAGSDNPELTRGLRVLDPEPGGGPAARRGDAPTFGGRPGWGAR